MSSKLYKLALWYIRKWHATDRSYRQEVEKMEWLTYKNCGKAHLIYGLGAEWESIGRYEVIDNAIQRLWEYENKQNEQPKTDWIPCEVEMPPMPKENPLYENKPLQVYLVSVKNCEEPFRAFWNGKDFTDGWSKLDVEAWMNLPQPYKKEGAENE